MADQIVSWGGFNSKGTSGMGVTGSFQVSSSANSFFVGGGSVGVGTTSPSKKLDVVGTAADGIIRVAGPYSEIQLINKNSPFNTGDWKPSIYFLENGIFQNSISYNGGFEFGGGITVTGSITNTGNANIGLTNSDVTVDIGGRSQLITFTDYNYGLSRGGINLPYVASPSGYGMNIYVNSGAMTFSTGGSTRLSIAQAGGVTISGSGTTSSTTALLVQNANASASLEVKDDRSVTVSGILTANSSSTIAGPLTVNFGGVVGGTSITANGNTSHNQGRGIYATGYAYGIQANQTMVGNWGDQPNAAGVHGTGQIGVYGEGSIAGFSGPSAFFTALSGDARVNARIASSVVQIRGTGTTSSTTALLVQNSNASASLAVLDNGNIGIGTATPSASLHVVGNTILSGSAGSGSALLAYKSGSTVVDIQGSSGQLFSVTDSLSGSLFSVNTVAGLPVIEAFSNNVVNIGKYGAYGLVVSGSDVAVATGSSAPTGTPQEGTFKFVASGGSYYIYAYIGGAWRSGSLA